MAKSLLKPSASLLFFAGLLGLTDLFVTMAHAGPAKYDQEKRTIRLTYTFATIPSPNMTPDQIQQLGQRQEPTEEQEKNVRSLFQEANAALFDATGKRAKIDPLDYVDTIKAADVVISLTDFPDRGGFATLGTIEGRPGQVGLYYRVLFEKNQRQEAALTIAHEVCHYLFGLPDEYSNGTICPSTNAGGPGCLMDNYFTRRGFYGKFCQADHNPNAPNPMTLAHEHTAGQPCQLWVDRFFQLRPPSAAVPFDEHQAEPLTLNSEQPFTGRFRALVNSAIMVARADAAKGGIGKNRATIDPGSSELSKVKNIAKKFLESQLKAFSLDSDFIKPTKDQVSTAIDLIARSALTDDLGMAIKPTESFTMEIINKLRTKAREKISAQPPKAKEGDDLHEGLSEGTLAQKLKMFQPAINEVKKFLLSYIKESFGLKVGSAPGADTVGPAEQRVVERIAREAVMGTSDLSEHATLSQAAKLHIRLSLVTAQNLIDVTSELDVPGAESRLFELRKYDDQLKRFAIPGKTFTGFGRRRTYIVAPPPLTPARDIVHIEAGDTLPYDDLRKLAVDQISRLIQRERTEEFPNPLATPIDPSTMASGDRFRYMNRVFGLLTEQVRRNRVENIIFLVPPGGVATELSDDLEVLRAQLQKTTDVRMDVILMFDANIPHRLRDEVYQSGGSVHFIADIDEIGSIAQRLKNDIAAGSWVSYPEQGTIELAGGPGTVLDANAAAGAPAPNFWRDIKQVYVGNSETHEEGLISRAKRDIDDLLSIFNFISSNGMLKKDSLPAEFDRVRAVYSRLDELKSRLEKIRGHLDGVRIGQVSAPIAGALKEIQGAKHVIQAIFWDRSAAGSPFSRTDDSPDSQASTGSFLTRTDDAFDGRMRDSIQRRAVKLEDAAKNMETYAQSLKSKIDDLGDAGDKESQVKQGEIDVRKHFLILSAQGALHLRMRAAVLWRAVAEWDRVVSEYERRMHKEVLLARRDFDQKNLYERVLDLYKSYSEELPKGRPWDEESRIRYRIETIKDRLVQAKRRGKALLSETMTRKIETQGQCIVNPDALVSIAENLITYLQTLQILNDSVAASPLGGRQFDMVYKLESIMESLERASNCGADEVRLAKALARLSSLVASNDSYRRLELREQAPGKEPRRDGEGDVADLFRFQSSDYIARIQQLRSTMSKRSPQDASTSKTYSGSQYNHTSASSGNPMDVFMNTLMGPVYGSVDDRSVLKSAYDVYGDFSPYNISSRDNVDPATLCLVKIYYGVGRNPESKKEGDKSKDLRDAARKLLDEMNASVIFEDAEGPQAKNPFQIIRGVDLERPKDPREVSEALGGTSELFQGISNRLNEAKFLSSKLGQDPKLNPIGAEDSFLIRRSRVAVADYIQDWVEEKVYERFPLALHDIHERLRLLERGLRGLDKDQVLEAGARPVFERIKERRPINKAEAFQDGKSVVIKFKPFIAEEGADYELVVGLSKPILNFERLKDTPADQPQIRLFVNDELVDRPYLRMEPERSSETMLVFRIPKPDLKAGLLGQGRYTPQLLIRRDSLPGGGDGRIGYTFSVATRRPNVQIIAAIRQPQPKDGDRDPAKDPEFAFRGVIAPNQFDTVVEAEVFAGAPVLEATVSGSLQRIDKTNEAIETPSYTFKDDGVYPDLLKDDGLYTARVTLQPAARRTAAEYRVSIQAVSRKETRFFPLVDPVFKSGPDKIEEAPPPAVPNFQRSTSINFHAQSEN